ncbi:MAG: L-seryl-tRNA(Sec) selenium transferase [Rhodocyclaceae bacterium]|nr:L-seryl-tRNA(Sec) selenium transferase [Rhodocyclaceae bacterium]
MNPFSQLPSVDRLLAEEQISLMVERHGCALVTNLVRDVLADARSEIKGGGAAPSLATLVARVGAGDTPLSTPKLRPVLNLTGTVLHTNLGRAVLPEEAIAAIVSAARSPCALEFDLQSGGRGDRDEIVNDLLCKITGAEAATVVNNNAAAVFLLLNTLAQKKRVIVSRGELVEIGGAFRIPDIMSRAGAKLIEVGTTNRTHLKGFVAAIDEAPLARTAMLMKVHTSNYSIQGFTHSVAESELAELAHRHGLPMVTDLGSGTLVDFRLWGLPYEPTASEAIAAGADLVTFSGDKLLGGPQAGMLVGKRELIEKIKKNPLKRALRVGKITLAALEAVLRLYLDPDRLPHRLTTLRHLTRTEADIREQTLRLLPGLLEALTELPVNVEVVPLRSQIGSGALPADRLESAGFAIRPKGKRSGVLNLIERRLRHVDYPGRPIIGRIDDGSLLLDLRCLDSVDEDDFLACLAALKAPQ